MTLLIGGRKQSIDNYLLGYLVLSTKKNTEFPLLSNEVVRSTHIKGKASGVFVCSSSDLDHIYNPSRSTRYTAFSSFGLEENARVEGMRSALEDLSVEKEVDISVAKALYNRLVPTLKPHSLVVLESSQPLGLVVLMAKSSGLQLFGMFNKDQASLVFTNIQNFEDLVKREFGDKWWFYRFTSRSDSFAVLFTRRVCSRWHSWSKQPRLQSESVRFAALEKSMFKDLYESPP
jgi:hypothetical protein